MCSYREPEQGLKKHDIQDDDQLVGEELDSILKTLEEIGNKFRSAFHRADNSIGDVQGKIKESNGKLYHLVDDILLQFERFEREMEGFTEYRRTLLAGKMKDHVACQDLLNLCKIDTKEKLTNLERIKEIKEKTKELERMTDEKFTVLFKALQHITKEFQGHTQNQERLIGNIQERFSDHARFIRSYLTREKEQVERSLKELEANLQEKLSALDKKLQEIHSEIDKSGHESERLKTSINCEFTEIIENIISRDWSMRLKQLPVLQCRNFEYLPIRVNRELHSQGHGIASYKALKELIDSCHLILNNGFDSAFKRFTEIKEDSKQHTNDLNEIERGLEDKFLKLKESIQSNLK